MLSKENIEKLIQRNISYVVGGRLYNTSHKIVEFTLEPYRQYFMN